MPDVASAPLKSTASGWLYQPLASGGRAGAAVTLGGEASYPSENVASALVLPARSLHAPVNDAFASSGPEYTRGAVHESIPEVASEPSNATRSGWLYQPFESGSLAGTPYASGAVESYLRPNETTLVLPAWSTQEPGTDAFGESGPEYVCGGTQESSPEVASVPAKLTERAWLYQPFASGARDGVAVTFGPVSSYWKTKLPTALVFPARSRQVPATEAFTLSGPEYVVSVHESIPDIASAPLKLTVSVWLYQPLWSGPRDALAPVTCGAVAS
jgi:hypothetical protein